MTQTKPSSFGLKSVGVALCVATLGGCAAEVVTDEREIAALGRSEAPLSWEEFRDSAYREPGADGAYIVDGDIALPDEDALGAYYDSWQDASTGLTVMQSMGADTLWAFPANTDLTYCVSSTGFGSNRAALITALGQATASWSSRVGVQFRHVTGQDGSCTSTNNNVVFDVNPAPSGAGYGARAFFPHYSRSSRNVLVSTSAFTGTSGGRDLQGVLRHELGHALGFRHEHIWLSPQCTGESTDNARQVTTYDVNSVMHYPQCRPTNSGGYRQTESDFVGAVELYGIAPALAIASGAA